jgi:hypothetical protein
MGAWEFRGKEWLKIDDPSGGLNPQPQVTIEALCQLLEAGQNPTVFCRPFSRIWEPPYVSWRLGFYSDQRLPEFQLLFEGDDASTTARSERPVALFDVVHLAGSYDGETVKLYVNGAAAASKARQGQPATSEQEVVVGVRSATDQGGYLVGRIFDLRYWQVARTSEEVNFWKNRTLPVPMSDEGCVGYWHTEPRLPVELRKRLSEGGFSGQELSFFDFIHQYSYEYSRIAGQLLNAETLELYPSRIHTPVVIKVSDGYLVFYEPGPAEYLAKFPIGSNIDIQDEGLVILNPSGSSVSETIQGLTDNSITLSIAPATKGDWKIQDLPENIPGAVDWMFSSELKELSARPPEIQLLALPRQAGTQDDVYGHNRIRVISPVLATADGNPVRAFTWLFVDLWLGDIGWDHTIKGFVEALAFNDALAVSQFSSVVHPLNKVIQLDIGQPLSPLKNRVREFRELIEQENVDEVRDVLPFLSRPENWFLLSPTCEHVWPEKMLGNKWRVDFLVREPGNLYTAIEIESPTKRLYKTGKEIEPYNELYHAEHQVRDYCNFIDRNLDYVEREEGLTGIYKPNGVVVIGRRAMLSPEGAKKLEERNADSTRYTIMTFDDLIEQAEAMVRRLEAIV